MCSDYNLNIASFEEMLLEILNKLYTRISYAFYRVLGTNSRWKCKYELVFMVFSRGRLVDNKFIAL